MCIWKGPGGAARQLASERWHRDAANGHPSPFISVSCYPSDLMQNVGNTKPGRKRRADEMQPSSHPSPLFPLSWKRCEEGRGRQLVSGEWVKDYVLHAIPKAGTQGTVPKQAREEVCTVHKVRCQGLRQVSYSTSAAWPSESQAAVSGGEAAGAARAAPKSPSGLARSTPFRFRFLPSLTVSASLSLRACSCSVVRWVCGWDHQRPVYQ